MSTKYREKKKKNRKFSETTLSEPTEKEKKKSKSQKSKYSIYPPLNSHKPKSNLNENNKKESNAKTPETSKDHNKTLRTPNTTFKHNPHKILTNCDQKQANPSKKRA